MAIIINNGCEGKLCSTCKKWKPLEDFSRDRTHGSLQGGRHCRCKKCHRDVYRKKVASKVII